MKGKKTKKSLEEKLEKVQDNSRIADYPVNPIILGRWSPRAMSGEKMTFDELTPLLEAARWAPSSYNNQPTRFLYAMRESPYWDIFFYLLDEFNQSWVKNAAIILVVISKETFDHNGELSITHSFDAGAAWENLALQGSISGYVVHGMQGFDYEKAKKELGIPEGYKVEAMIAIGKPGLKSSLPEALQKREIPSGRKKIEEISYEGKFPEEWS